MIKSVLEDWIFLALLGTIMAVLSLWMDLAIEYLHDWHVLLYKFTRSIEPNQVFNIIPLCAFSIWCLYSVGLVLASATFVHYVAPQAIGSGIPEMKTILRGVVLKEYLTLKTLIAKMVGLTLSLGSGMPLGKEGPFVHVASVVANLLNSLTTSYDNPHANESRNWEMLAAACAVGVSSTFSAPIGGVLFSIEVTSVHFAIQDYWRGFFAASCCAFLLNLLKFVTETEVTIAAFYQTSFPKDAFFPSEMPIFALIGVACGLLASIFILLQRIIVLFLRNNKFAKVVFQKHWMVYPIIVSLLISAAAYPHGFGSFFNGQKTFSNLTKDFFHICTYSAPLNGSNRCPEYLLQNYMKEGQADILISLSYFCAVSFILNVLASTLPVPSGIFGPSYVFGAAFGRLIGELVAIYFPDGILGPELSNIFPGIYSIVGAAAFVAGVTHTISVAVIVFELTGQVFYLLPVMLAVLIANTISSHLQPSIYDSMVKIKRLPYLPVIPYAFVDTFHGRQSTYSEVRQLLLAQPQINTFPIVENPESSILIGTCSRRRLLKHIARKSGTRNPKRSPSVDKLHDIPTQLVRSKSYCDEKSDPKDKKRGTTIKRSITSFSFARVKDMQSVRIYTRHCKQDAPIINWLEVVDFDELEIDSAPLQVMTSCSLFKLHSLFSLMKLSRAYVTKCGKLIGLITLEDLRLAVENVKNGKLLETEQETCEQRASLAHKEAEENLNNDVLTPKLEVIRGKTGAKKLSRDLSKISRVENLL